MPWFVPAAEDFCFACHACAPALLVLVAPGPAAFFAPYVIVNAWPAERVTPETVIVCPDTVTVPTLEAV